MFKADLLILANLIGEMPIRYCFADFQEFIDFQKSIIQIVQMFSVFLRLGIWNSISNALIPLNILKLVILRELAASDPLQRNLMPFSVQTIPIRKNPSKEVKSIWL